MFYIFRLWHQLVGPLEFPPVRSVSGTFNNKCARRSSVTTSITLYALISPEMIDSWFLLVSSLSYFQKRSHVILCFVNFLYIHVYPFFCVCHKILCVVFFAIWKWLQKRWKLTNCHNNQILYNYCCFLSSIWWFSYLRSSILTELKARWILYIEGS